MRLNPNRSELYRHKVAELAITLADPAIAQPAREVVSGLIERASVSWEANQAVVALDGVQTALIGLATKAKGPAGAGPFGSWVNLVSGAGFEPSTYTSTLQVMVRRDRGPSGAA